MSESLRKCLSEILVNTHRAFHLIPIKKNKEERGKINKIFSIVDDVAYTLDLEAGREVDAIIQKEITRDFQAIDDVCMLITRESNIEDEDYLIDMERIILGGGLP